MAKVNNIKRTSSAQQLRISPSQPKRISILMFLGVWILSLLLGMVFINVLQVRYGQEIENRKTEVALLRNDVRDLRSQKAKLTAFSIIEDNAKKIGMIYPKKANKTLIVRVPRGTIPPTWQDKLSATEVARRQAEERRNLTAWREAGSP